MNYLEQVQRGVDYIEHALDSDISLAEVAKIAGISQWHFQRIFKALTNETLKTYIRSRRLAKALDKLLTTRARIIDIAMSAGFESQESFTRAFKKAFGMTPNEYRKLGAKSQFLRKVQFDEDYLRHLHQNISLVPEIAAQPPLALVGMRTRFHSVDSEKNNIGQQLTPLWQAFLPRLREIPGALRHTCYGVVEQTEPDSDLLQYHAAVEVSEAYDLPPEMTCVVVPGATYARFTHRGEVKHIDRTVNYIYSTWLTQSGRRHTGGADLEIYGTDYDASSATSVMYYAIPVV